MSGKDKDTEELQNESDYEEEETVNDDDEETVDDETVNKDDETSVNEEEYEEYEEDDDLEEEGVEEEEEGEEEEEEEVIEETIEEEEDDDDEGDEYEYGDDEEDVAENDELVFDDPDDVDIQKQSVRVPDEERITKPVLTKYELTRIIGIRTAQLAKGANPLISNVQNKPPIRIAIDELLLKKTPFKIKRPMPYPEYEIWKISEMEIPLSQDDIDDLILAIK